MTNEKNKTMALTSLFLSQSYADAWEDYRRSLLQPSFPVWDYIILTASNEQQAAGFRIQIERRKKAAMLPAKTHFAVLPDPQGVRVGSGGATLGVLRYIAEQEGTSDFSNLRILVIHSGGDSRRVPQYSALGKLFSPVPHELPGGQASTLFDEFMISMAALPGRIREGMVLLSGDVLLLFNPLLVDFSGRGAAAISFKENVETGKNHGVFLCDEDGHVKRCLQKQSVEVLRSAGAVNAQNCVDIDTGAIIFSKEVLQTLWGVIAENEKVTDTSFQKMVNAKTRLSLYVDFLYPFGKDSTRDAFLEERPEGEMCPELIAARTILWDALRPYRMKILRLTPAKFIHFGTSREILSLNGSEIDEYKNLGWSQRINSSLPINKKIAGYNSVLSEEVICGDNCYLEDSYVHGNSTIGDHVILSYIEIQNRQIPSNVVIHGLKQKNGQFVVRIFGLGDNPKGDIDTPFLDSSLRALMNKYSLSASCLWEEGDAHSLWNAKLYPSCKNIDDALDAALNLYRLIHGQGDFEAWKHAERKSLCSGFGDADNQAICDWDARISDLCRICRVTHLIQEEKPATDGIAILQADHLTSVQKKYIKEKEQSADFSEKIRLYYYIGIALGNENGAEWITKSFRYLSESMQTAYTTSSSSIDFVHRPIAKPTCCIHMPLRVNWGGGWSDTPPYCVENGGTVLNAAITLRGKYPVEVTLMRIPERKIIFDSCDMDVHGEFDNFEELMKTGDPLDPFALQKAALLACGILPMRVNKLPDLFDIWGGGFEMRSEVRGVPKGSGLGTSSILAAACAKALYEFFDIPYTNDTLYSTVLVIEQIMSTGGGWQDQVGGITGGVKMITSKKGLCQKIHVEPVIIPANAWEELKERFALIYTGQRRLARNLLRDIVGKYIGNDAEAQYALNKIQRTACLMQFELAHGNIDAFAALLNEQWKLSKLLDSESANTLIDQILESVSDLIDGEMICGAGGGGFLQVILKKGISKQLLDERLKEVFMDSGIGVWDCELI